MTSVKDNRVQDLGVSEPCRFVLSCPRAIAPVCSVKDKRVNHIDSLIASGKPIVNDYFLHADGSSTPSINKAGAERTVHGDGLKFQARGYVCSHGETVVTQSDDDKEPRVERIN